MSARINQLVQEDLRRQFATGRQTSGQQSGDQQQQQLRTETGWVQSSARQQGEARAQEPNPQQ